VFCIECGKEILDTAKFCSHCGKRTSIKRETARTPTELKNKSYQCSACNFSLDVKMDRCPRCKGILSENRPLFRQERGSENYWVCDGCNIEFENESEAIEHEKNCPQYRQSQFFSKRRNAQREYNQAPRRREPTPLDSPGTSLWVVFLGASALFIIGVFLMSYGGNEEVSAQVIYSECWAGAFIDTYMNSISIEGCGNETFSCGTGSGICVINAQKQEDNEKQLCVEVGDKRACTTAGYGVAQV